MPTMIRPKGKATKIAYSVMGIPPAMQKSRKKRVTRSERNLEAWETSRIK